MALGYLTFANAPSRCGVNGAWQQRHQQPQSQSQRNEGDSWRPFPNYKSAVAPQRESAREGKKKRIPAAKSKKINTEITFFVALLLCDYFVVVAVLRLSGSTIMQNTLIRRADRLIYLSFWFWALNKATPPPPHAHQWPLAWGRGSSKGSWRIRFIISSLPPQESSAATECTK